MTIFQFHKGTIRTSGQAESLNSAENFNSIKVRLERILRTSHKVVEIDFNSIKVRLEHYEGMENFWQWTNFNSIKVRLEHDGNLTSYPDSLISIP